nr:BON domain-containing protein [Rhizobium laguerreae]
MSGTLRHPGRPHVDEGQRHVRRSPDVQFQKAAAEHAVRKLGGVVGILNLLTIRPCPTVPDVRRRIEEALKRSAEVDAGGISVKVQDDKVVLEGGVCAWHERGVAERTAWSVPGVTAVENHIRIN